VVAAGQGVGDLFKRHEGIGAHGTLGEVGEKELDLGHRIQHRHQSQLIIHRHRRVFFPLAQEFQNLSLWRLLADGDIDGDLAAPGLKASPFD